MQRLFILLQYVLPKTWLSRMAGKLADSRVKWLKNLLINHFIRIYAIDLSLAALSDPLAYETFNAFFIRQLKHSARPIDTSPRNIASPVDGCVTELGDIVKDRLLQVKGQYFGLATLLNHEKSMIQHFHNGLFATFYLAPHNYHRIHMPVDGILLKTLFIPGKLFSVNQTTVRYIPELYNRNERLICLFDTPIGKMAVILVGAMMVGSIQTVWMTDAIKANKITETIFQESDHVNRLFLKKGDELGYFKFGSTVIVLFEKDAVTFSPSLHNGRIVQFGEEIGSL